MMKVLQYIERIEMIHKLVEQECTGTPEEFARRLGISRTRLYEIMDDLKLEGAPIAYSRSTRTFYYEEPFHIEISFELRPLGHEETGSIGGGIMPSKMNVHDPLSIGSGIMPTTRNVNDPLSIGGGIMPSAIIAHSPFFPYAAVIT